AGDDTAEQLGVARWVLESAACVPTRQPQALVGQRSRELQAAAGALLGVDDSGLRDRRNGELGAIYQIHLEAKSAWMCRENLVADRGAEHAVRRALESNEIAPTNLQRAVERTDRERRRAAREVERGTSRRKIIRQVTAGPKRHVADIERRVGRSNADQVIRQVEDRRPVATRAEAERLLSATDADVVRLRRHRPSTPLLRRADPYVQDEILEPAPVRCGHTG